jgi:hypothetical protein
MVKQMVEHIAWFLLNLVPLFAYGLVLLLFQPAMTPIGIAFSIVVAVLVSFTFEAVKVGIEFLMQR